MHTSLQFSKKLKGPACEAATDGSPAESRFYIRDSTNKINFLVDTGADVSVYRRHQLHRPTKETSYSLYSVTGQRFPTYGLYGTGVNLGLRRELAWHFVIADTSTAILGAEFLGHFGLLVDVRNRRLIDSATNIVSRGEVREIDAPTIKIISSDINAPLC